MTILWKTRSLAPRARRRRAASIRRRGVAVRRRVTAAATSATRLPIGPRKGPGAATTRSERFRGAKTPPPPPRLPPDPPLKTH